MNTWFVLFITLTYGGSHEFSTPYQDYRSCEDAGQQVSGMDNVRDFICLPVKR